MIDKIITFALQQRFLVLTFTLLLIGLGLYSAKKLPIDAFPDVTNIQVQIITEAEGMAPTLQGSLYLRGYSRQKRTYLRGLMPRWGRFLRVLERFINTL